MKHSLLDKWYYLYKDRNFRKYEKLGIRETFSQVYDQNIWGGIKGDYYSGSGTHNKNTCRYVERVTEFMRETSITTVAEIGCGDFTITQQVLKELPCIQYTGIDVVPGLIERNNRLFGTGYIQFQTADATKDRLPDAQLVIIRQVLQHLNNEQVQSILQQIRKYRFALITEHLPIGPDVVVNLNKSVGPHIRMRINSGVFIEAPPFSINNSSVFLEYREDDLIKGKTVPAIMRTYLVKNMEAI